MIHPSSSPPSRSPPLLKRRSRRPSMRKPVTVHGPAEGDSPIFAAQQRYLRGMPSQAAKMGTVPSAGAPSHTRAATAAARSCMERRQSIMRGHSWARESHGGGLGCWPIPDGRAGREWPPASAPPAATIAAAAVRAAAGLIRCAPGATLDWSIATTAGERDTPPAVARRGSRIVARTSKRRGEVRQPRSPPSRERCPRRPSASLQGPPGGPLRHPVTSPRRERPPVTRSAPRDG